MSGYQTTVADINPDALPVNEHGQPYNLVAHVNDTLIFADHHAELLGSFITGYDGLIFTGDDEATQRARTRYATHIANLLQNSINEEAEHAGILFDYSNEQIEALTGNRQLPYTGIDGDLQWNIEIPLVLVNTHYAPYTDHSRPEGKIIWIEAHYEMGLLSSLQRLGLIRYGSLKAG